MASMTGRTSIEGTGATGPRTCTECRVPLKIQGSVRLVKMLPTDMASSPWTDDISALVVVVAISAPLR